jgi:hypothetical protein
MELGECPREPQATRRLRLRGLSRPPIQKLSFDVSCGGHTAPPKRSHRCRRQRSNVRTMLTRRPVPSGAWNVKLPRWMTISPGSRPSPSRPSSGQSNPAAISTNPKMTRVCPMPAPSLRFSGRFGLERRRPIRRSYRVPPPKPVRPSRPGRAIERVIPRARSLANSRAGQTTNFQFRRPF